METSEKIVVFGASRGLGAAVVSLLQKQELLLVSRKPPVALGARSQFAQFNLANVTEQTACVKAVRQFAPMRLIYSVAGGPFGSFGSKAWKDHEWAWEVSFRFPARLLHEVLAAPIPSLRQVVFVGSQIAEAQADPFAASYAAAKHALKGLVTSVQGEKPALDVRLFSPGYMDTELLPKNAWPRQSPGLVQDPGAVARQLLEFINIAPVS